MIRILFTTIILLFSTVLFSIDKAGSVMQGTSTAYSEGMDGWTTALTGMLIAFVGIILVLIGINAFRIFSKKDKKFKSTSHELSPADIKPAMKAEEVPEEHMIAIATAVELYKRLYLINSMGSLTFKQSDSRSWKIVNKFGQR